MNHERWRGCRVLVTGHTGFKGAWLSLWLEQMGATTFGIALPPPDGGAHVALRPTLEAERDCDIRDRERVFTLIHEWRPEVVFHLAAQALVPEGYRDAIGTFETNVTGTVNVISAAVAAGARAVVVVTSDKVYANDGSGRAFTESDPLGGHDPYSASKACADIAARSLRSLAESSGTAIAVARAGNVIGGGDVANPRGDRPFAVTPQPAPQRLPNLDHRNLPERQRASSSETQPNDSSAGVGGPSGGPMTGNRGGPIPLAKPAATWSHVAGKRQRQNRQRRWSPTPNGGPACKAHPAAHSCGISVISSGEFPVIGANVAADRLLPDAWRAVTSDRPLRLRNPDAVRPWQFVLEPLLGYLLLAERLLADPAGAPEAVNFGPRLASCRPVREVVELAFERFGRGAWEPAGEGHPLEAALLRLDSALAQRTAGWSPLLDLESSVAWTVAWWRSETEGQDLRAAAIEQLKVFEAVRRGV